jgi:hypothetical protein
VFCDNCGYDLRTVAPAPSAQPPLPPTSASSQSETGDIICPVCQHVNIAGSAFCENCGAKLSQAAATPQPPATEVEAPVPPRPEPPQVQDTVTGRLVLTDSQVTLPIPPGKPVIVIGREDPVSGVFPDIDLDPHGGHEAGVGRRHAQLMVKNGQVYIEDLDSVNGTAVNRQRIASREPHPLQTGDEIRLGKMAIVYYTG